MIKNVLKIHAFNKGKSHGFGGMIHKKLDQES